jgi:drug/metabolite transporter (DMT)-like permease
MSRQTSSPLYPAVAAAVTIIAWATAFPAIKLALVGLQALPLASVRYAIAAVVAVVWLLWRRPVRMARRDLIVCGVCGVVAGAGYSVLLNFGQQTISAGAASFLIKTESLWMAALAVVALGEKFSTRGWVGTASAVIGVGLIALGKSGSLTVSIDPGALFVLAAAVCSAAGFTFQRKMVVRYGALHVSAVAVITAALALSPWLPTAFAQVAASTPETAAWVAFLGIFPTTIGLICWTYALGYFGVARAGNLLYLIAPLATAIAWIIADETPSWATLVGGVLILSGVVIVNLRSRRAMAPPSSSRETVLAPAQTCARVG